MLFIITSSRPISLSIRDTDTFDEVVEIPPQAKAEIRLNRVMYFLHKIASLLLKISGDKNITSLLRSQLTITFYNIIKSPEPR